MSYIGRTPTNAALTASDLADGIVTTAKIDADAVTDAKIADDVVGTEHLTANEVDTTALGADAVTGAQLADNAVNSEHYTDGSIDTAHLADGQVTTAKLATAVFTGATDIGAAIVDADLFLMDDGAGGTIRKTAASRIKTYASGLTGVSTGSGNVTITDGNLVLASGHGIDFAATGNISGTDNELLNDYEEGTFTPSFTVAGGSLTAAAQVGRYVKVGDLVHVQIALSTNGISSPSGNTGISGLPFTCKSGCGSSLSIAIIYRWDTDFDGDLVFRIDDDTTSIAIWKNASNSSSADQLQGSSFLDGSSKNQLIVSGTYQSS